MAERLGAGDRPIYARRAGVLVLAVVAMLLIAIAAAVAIGMRPFPTVPMTFNCASRGPAFPGERRYPIVVSDQTGRLAGCRQFSYAEVIAVRSEFGLEDGRLDIWQANADGTRLLIVWLKHICSTTVRADLTAGTRGQVELALDQQESAGCSNEPGSAASNVMAVELKFDQSLLPGNVLGAMTRTQAGPWPPNFNERRGY
jgi:hypothetical protein